MLLFESNCTLVFGDHMPFVCFWTLIIVGHIVCLIIIGIQDCICILYITPRTSFILYIKGAS